jgi:hypothetical protein
MMAGMTRVISLTVLALAACAAPQPDAQQESTPIELQGMVRAGDPVHCVTIYPLHSLLVSENNRNVLLYNDGRLTYSNELARYCRFRPDDVIVTEPLGSQHCRGDIVRSFDRISHIPGAGCVLGEFVPYTKPRT